MRKNIIKEYEIKKIGQRMINACKRLHMLGLLSGPGGNISHRTSIPNIIICSPSGVPIMDMFVDDLCIVELQNSSNSNYKVLEGKYKPTSEILLHCEVYRSRPEIMSIVHTHPPFVTAFACTDEIINFEITEDKAWYIGEIEYMPFINGSTKELAEAALPKLEKSYVLVLRNHGLVALGDCLAEAVNITELVESLARTYFYSKLMGKWKEIEVPYIKTRDGLIYHDEIFD